MRPQNHLKLALVQTEMYWQDKTKNLLAFGQKLDKLDVDVDLVVLPEMFTTGFTMHPEGLAETMDGPTVEWMQRLSKAKPFAICGSFIATEQGKFFNRFFWAVNGKVEIYYDKRHLFSMAGEHKTYAPGVKSPVIEFKGWRVLPRVCYDLRFPVWCRTSDVDLQIYVANWPQARVSAWDKLLMARAIENQCYVAGVNRTGMDGNDIPYCGHSIVIDPKGEPLTPVSNEKDEILTVRIALDELSAFREKFPLGNDADKFRIEL